MKLPSKNFIKQLLITLALLAVLLVADFCTWNAKNKIAASHSPSPSSQEALFIRNKEGHLVRFDVKLAVHQKDREQGLMHVTSLPDNEGMLFLFNKAETVSMWMKDTPLSLDMVFISADGTIVHIAPHTIPNSQGTISSLYPVQAVLEIKGGMAEKNALQKGDSVLGFSRFKTLIQDGLS